MGIFSRKRDGGCGATASQQLLRQDTGPFGLPEAVDLGPSEARLYRAIREAVPLIDACIYKIIRLCSGVHVECEDQRAQAELNRFLEEALLAPAHRHLL